MGSTTTEFPRAHLSSLLSESMHSNGPIDDPCACAGIVMYVVSTINLTTSPMVTPSSSSGTEMSPARTHRFPRIPCIKRHTGTGPSYETTCCLPTHCHPADLRRDRHFSLPRPPSVGQATSDRVQCTGAFRPCLNPASPRDQRSPADLQPHKPARRWIWRVTMRSYYTNLNGIHTLSFLSLDVIYGCSIIAHL